MSAEVHDEGIAEVTLDKAEAELERLLSDQRFRLSDRQRDILKYLANRRFSGCRESVKAYSIALDVLGRSSDFDASTDPIVRIEISRLRTTLDSYYSIFGSEFGVAIHIPKGSYITLFPCTPMLADDEEPHAEEVAAAPEVQAAPAAVRSPRRWKLALGGVAAAAMICILGWTVASRPTITIKPTVTVSISAVSPELEGDASVTRDTLMAALSQFDTMIVAKAGYSTSIRKSQYDLSLKYYADSDDRTIWWQLVDSSDGRLIKAGLEKVDLEGKAPVTVRLQLAGAVARRVASARGVVNSVLARQAPVNALGSACIARAEIMLDAGDDHDRPAMTQCLERTLARDPGDTDASAALAKVYARDPRTAAQSLELAKAAVSAEPLSDRAQSALMVARFANARIDAAIDAGNRAMTLNPNNSATMASLAFVLFSGGYWKAASDMAQEASAMEETIPGDAALVLALEAYRNGNWSEASLLAEQALGNDVLTRSIRAAALGELGSGSATRRLEDAMSTRNEFEGAFRQAARSAQLQPDLIAALESGLAKAGANFDAVASISGQ